MTGNSADPYSYPSYQPGRAPMTGMILNNRRIGEGGYMRGLFPVPAGQVGRTGWK